MLIRHFAATALLLTTTGLCACADAVPGDEGSAPEDLTQDEVIAQIDELVAGDGSEFLAGSASVAADEGSDATSSESQAPEGSAPPLAAIAQAAVTCPAGAICRAESPRAEDLDRNGPYKNARYDLRSGRDHGGATVYYPTDAKPPFAYAVYCPPYTATRSAFAAWGPFFASHGIVLATMDTATVGDYPPRRAKGLVEMMDTLRAENRRANGPLQGKLDENRGGVLGWSMGGGGVWIASGDHPEWKSAITLAGHNLTATGWERSARRSTIPTLMMNGATDVTYLGGLGQSDNAYNAIPATTNKLLYVFGLLGHFEWGSPTAGSRAVGRYVMAWEKTFLEGDERYRSFLLQRGPGASTWQTNMK